MLHVIQSNKMEVLADSLITYVQETAQQGTSIFESDQVLVQSPGMSQWLKIQIANAMGIAANIDFPLPSSFIWQLYRQYIPDLPEQSAFTKPNMTWKLISILPKMLARDEFAPIKTYLADKQSLKLYQLAGKIADVYDQYLVYRPEWILSWEEGQDELTDLAHVLGDNSAQQSQKWQSMLWRELVKYCEMLGESIYHRANLHHLLLSALQSPDARKVNPTDKPQKPLLVFGISAMPLQQLEVLNALASQRDVVIFWFNPSQHYWGDIVDSKTQAKTQLKAIDKPQIGAELFDVGNPLLASWGKLGRDYQDMLLAFDIQQQDCFIQQHATNLLEHIQVDINELQFRNTPQQLDANELLSNGTAFPKIELEASDHSLQIHACHSKVRELEILHDQLLKRFNDNPDWSPADIIVMMPDVATYAPYIEGVFGAVAKDLYIPYAISDRNYGQVSPLIISFINIMKLHQSRLTLSEVLALLEVPAIQNKFDISLQEFEIIQHWLNTVGIRWGWNGEDKSRWDLPPESQNTWLFGLQRLLAGYAMSEHSLFVGQQQLIAPYSDIEGQQAVALGKCYAFIKVLLQALEFCLQEQSIAAKVEGALVFLDKLYQVEESAQHELITLRSSLEELLSHQHQYTEQLEQDIFVSELEQNIQEKGVGQRFLAGYVNFCTLMPMRSIPFKMVCLLGMNDADYPRQSVPMGFDLMRLAPAKRGDRSRRLDDRYLFLEALLSAREQLYFSYQGFSQKDNSVLSPSILLSELLEYCQQGFALRNQLSLDPEITEANLVKHLIVKHKLHAFDLDYFQAVTQLDQADLKATDLVEAEVNNNRLISFNSHLQSIAEQTRQSPRTSLFCESHSEPQSSLVPQNVVNSAPANPAINIDLNDLIEFFLNPAKAYFMHKWQSRFYPLNSEQSDVEPFNFDGLEKYQLNQKLVGSFIKNLQQEQDINIEVPHLLAEFRAQGLLPIGDSGEIAIQPMLQNSQTVAKQISDLSDYAQKSNYSIDLQLDDLTLTGMIADLYANKLILWRPGKLREKDKVCLYLQWLAVCCQPPETGLASAYFVAIDKVYSLPKIEQPEAEILLKPWLKVYLQGLEQVVHFYPKAAWQWLNTQDQNKTIQGFIGNQFSPGEGAEVHTQRVCPDLATVFDDFSQISEYLLTPLIELERQK